MSAPRTTVRRAAAVVLAALLALSASGCGNTDTWVDAHAADGWSAQYADAANSSSAPVDGATALRLDWIRSAKGQIQSQAALGSGDYLALNAQTTGGCSLMVWEVDNRARQRWCSRLW